MALPIVLSCGFVGSADRFACSKLLRAKVSDESEVAIEPIWKRAAAVEEQCLTWRSD